MTRGPRPCLLLWALAWCWILAAPAAAMSSKLKSDEQVIFFPTSGYLDPDGAGWTIPIHGWVFEPEDGSLWRGAVIEALARSLNLSAEAADGALFRRRARMFLVDNQSGKRFGVRLGERVFELGGSAPNGHFSGAARLAARDLPAASGGAWLGLEMMPPPGDGRSFEAMARLVGPAGLSVISDIDDTIKVSEVAKRDELLANTFLRPFRAVPGMAAAYRKWDDGTVAFHYLSASPWQLYPALSSFMAEAGFPRGSFHLKSFRMKDETFLNLFACSEQHKIPAIEAILRRYPGRRFLLVGDSGERDPEIYGEIARRFPGQVRHIFIRDVPAKKQHEDDKCAALAAPPADRLTVFRDPWALARYRLEAAD
jgi:hypothetical protein